MRWLSIASLSELIIESFSFMLYYDHSTIADRMKNDITHIRWHIYSLRFLCSAISEIEKFNGNTIQKFCKDAAEELWRCSIQIETMESCVVRYAQDNPVHTISTADHFELVNARNQLIASKQVDAKIQGNLDLTTVKEISESEGISVQGVHKRIRRLTRDGWLSPIAEDQRNYERWFYPEEVELIRTMPKGRKGKIK
jgi:hypothetical protein